MLQHIVLLSFHDSVSSEEIDDLMSKLQALIGVIPGLVEMSHGENNSTEGLSEGYTHCFKMKFDSVDSRDAYLPHPAHQACVEHLKPLVKQLLVFDF